MARIDGRAKDIMRPVKVTVGVMDFAEGSALIEMGLTRVMVTVTAEDRVPPFLRGRGKGWVTAEYAMLPRSTHTRTPRESVLGRIGGRTQEIQRLIGRSLRAVTDLSALGERTMQVDCDVLQADGGTRTASITAAYVALYQAFAKMVRDYTIPSMPLTSAVAAVSAGVVGREPLLDLCYHEDSRAEVDFNVVMTSLGDYVEVQGTAEGRPFSAREMDTLLNMAQTGIQKLFLIQEGALAAIKF